MPDTKPTTQRQSLLAPPRWPFKDLNARTAADGSPSFDRGGIEHICRLNSVPEAVFLEPDPAAHAEANGSDAHEWIQEWNSLAPDSHWHLVPGEYQQNQEILVFHWYLIYRLYGCTPVQAYEPHFLSLVGKLAHGAAGSHMHLLSEAPLAHSHPIAAWYEQP